MPRNIIKTLDKNFSDMKAGDQMYIASPEVVSAHIKTIKYGQTLTMKQFRRELALTVGADQCCPVTTGIFLRKAIEEVYPLFGIDESPLPFWRVVDENHPVLKKLGIPASDIAEIREKESILHK